MELKKDSKLQQAKLDKIASHPLQTQAWAEFRKAWGNEVVETKFGLITLHKIPFTPYKVGMFIKGSVPTRTMLDELRIMGKQKNIIFIKLEPNHVKSGESPAHVASVLNLLKRSGAVPGKTLFTPTTFWVDLTPSEEELMKSFNSKTRYNIRYAQRQGVEVIEDNSVAAFKRYLELTKETVKRQGFYAHSAHYHKLMWDYLGKRQEVKGKRIAHLLTARYKGEIITTWIVFEWKDFLYYPYGASTERYKNVMANNLMMWEAIKLGKKLGLKTFDLWGREEGKGFTKFKEGYNPKVVEFLGTWDLVINKRAYTIYRLAERVRWPILRLKTKFSKPSF